MKKRKYFLTALLLVLCGIYAHFRAFGYAAQAVEQINIAQKIPSETSASRAKVGVFHRQSDIAVYIGLTCAISGAFLAFVSYRREEPAPQLVVLVFLLFYAVLHLGVV